MNPTYIPQDTLKRNQTVKSIFAAIENGYFLFLLFFISSFCFSNQIKRVLKTVLEKIPRYVQPSFKKKRKMRKEGTSVAVLLLWKVSKIISSGMRLTELGTQWMLLCFFLICGDICWFLGILSGVSCRLSAI